MLPEQEKEIRKQIINQIESSFPEDKKESAIQQIKTMNSEEFMNFLEKNKIIKDLPEGYPKNQCIFCLIAEQKMDSYKIDENKDAVAVLELNPLSKGHVLVIPREHLSIEEISPKTFSLAKKNAKKIKSELKAEEVKIESSSLIGHGVLNIIPLYKDFPPKKRKASEDELKKLQKILGKNEEVPIEKSKIKKITDKKIWLPKRIP